jgi:hypothetical protein
VETQHELRLVKETMRHELHTEVIVNAPLHTVWEVVTDLSRYSTWNPFIVSAEGEAAVGERLTNRMQPPDGKGMTFKPTVTEAEVDSTFEWLGRLGVPGVFDGRHRFELSAMSDGGTRVVHREEFSGILVRFMRKSLDTQTKHGFELMNSALKSRAEATVGSQSGVG